MNDIDPIIDEFKKYTSTPEEELKPNRWQFVARLGVVGAVLVAGAVVAVAASNPGNPNQNNGSAFIPNIEPSANSTASFGVDRGNYDIEKSKQASVIKKGTKTTKPSVKPSSSPVASPSSSATTSSNPRSTPRCTSTRTGACDSVTSPPPNPACRPGETWCRFPGPTPPRRSRY
ncbi:MAG: hypothetical protein RL670_1255 [Actinomycetota bacterium]|jgi:hypothetical protein